MFCTAWKACLLTLSRPPMSHVSGREANSRQGLVIPFAVCLIGRFEAMFRGLQGFLERFDDGIWFLNGVIFRVWSELESVLSKKFPGSVRRCDRRYLQQGTAHTRCTVGGADAEGQLDRSGGVPEAVKPQSLVSPSNTGSKEQRASCETLILGWFSSWSCDAVQQT
jgi:hypothetical protein